MTEIRATVSGSFRRHLPQVQLAVRELLDGGTEVLSPANPVVVDQIEHFVFVASDLHRSPRLVQDRHLAAIAQSDFLWLVCPDGYVGPSAALEIGYAVSLGIPVWGEHAPDDLTLRQYVVQMDTIGCAISMARQNRRKRPSQASLLLDPIGATEAMHEAADKLRKALVTPLDKQQSIGLEKVVESERSKVFRLVSPSRVRVT